MSVLVTGGAGYIGCHTVRQLRAQDRDVVVLDTLESGFEAALLGAPLVVGDVADEALVRRVVREHDVDGVIHFAGYKNAGESMHAPGKYFANNTSASGALLRAIEGTGVTSLVFSGSCSVYGTPDALPVGESAPVRPESPYGQSKLMVEQMLRWYGEVHGLRWMSLRYFNAAGASADGALGEDFGSSLNLIPIAMKALLGLRPPVQVFGTDFPTADGTAIRDYIHVDDLARAHLLSLEHLEGGVASQAINLGTGVGSSVRQVLDVAAAASGRPVPAEYVARRPGDPAEVWADNRRAHEVLGWVPQYHLEEIIETAWRWHAAHPDGYGATAMSRRA